MERKKISPFIIQILVLIVIVAGICVAIDTLKNDVSDEQLQLAESAVYKYAAQCYALEGFYPSDILYLEENYGLVLSDKFIYHYAYIGSNMMPEIKVFYAHTN